MIVIMTMNHDSFFVEVFLLNHFVNDIIPWEWIVGVLIQKDSSSLFDFVG
jgi:hypothetical protein